MILSEVFKNEIEEAINKSAFIEPKYVAIDETDGSVWVFEDEPYIPNYIDPEDPTFFDVDTGGLLRIAEGNYSDFEEVMEYIGVS